MNTDYARNNSSNYSQDRSKNFKHFATNDMLAPAAPTVEAYIYNEKVKQMAKIRDWYLDSKTSQTDPVLVRSNFSKARKFSNFGSMLELDHGKACLINGSFFAVVICGLMLFMHF